MAAVQNGTSVQNGSSVTVEEGAPRFKPQEPASGFMRIMDIVNTITHLALGAAAFVVIFAAIILKWNSNKLSQHLILSVIGYVILMAQAILVMSPSNGWSRTIRYQDRKTVHLVMHVIGSIIALAGGIIIITEKDTHFNTTHGILGLVALILTIVSFIGGLVHLFTCMPRVTCLLHSVIGALTFIIAFLAIIFGVDSLFRPLFGDESTNSAIAVIVIGLVGTLLPSCLKLFRGCT